MTNYGKIGVLWYDVSWPLNVQTWESEKMNKMVFDLQPEIIVNNRNALQGDFATPEQQITAAPGGRAWIRLEAPANVAGPARTAWAMDELQGVGLLRLAAALGASPDALVAAAEGDAPLLATLALLASEDMAFEALAAITGSRAADACFAILARADALPQIFGERVNAIAWTRAAIQPSLWRETPPAAALAQLYAALRGPLPEAVGAALLDAPCWRAGLAGEAGAIASPSSETLAAAAALTPAPCRPALARQLAQAVDGRARRAQRLLEILALLEPGQPESDP